MRRAAVLLTAAVTAVLVLPVRASAAPPAQQAGDTGPVLTSVALSTGAVTVKGLDTVPVTVTVTATGDRSTCPANTGGVTFRRTNIHVWDRSATRGLVGTLTCVADNDGVRTYKATVPVPSTADGPWRLDAVVFGTMYYDPRSFNLPDATLVVTGTHRPGRGSGSPRDRWCTRRGTSRSPSRRRTTTPAHPSSRAGSRSPTTAVRILTTISSGGLRAASRRAPRESCGSCHPASARPWRARRAAPAPAG